MPLQDFVTVFRPTFPAAPVLTAFTAGPSARCTLTCTTILATAGIAAGASGGAA